MFMSLKKKDKERINRSKDKKKITKQTKQIGLAQPRKFYLSNEGKIKKEGKVDARACI